MTHIQRTTLGMAFTILLAAGCLLLQGCQTAPEFAAQPVVRCEPLPLCDIPAKSTSTQLELALYRCVHEYRALYSACAVRVEAPK